MPKPTGRHTCYKRRWLGEEGDKWFPFCRGPAVRRLMLWTIRSWLKKLPPVPPVITSPLFPLINTRMHSHLHFLQFPHCTDFRMTEKTTLYWTFIHFSWSHQCWSCWRERVQIKPNTLGQEFLPFSSRNRNFLTVSGSTYTAVRWLG